MSFSTYASYRPTGEKWVPELPDQWDLTSLRWLSKRYAGGTPDRGNDTYWEGGNIPWLNSGAVNDRYITKPSAYITRAGLAESSAKWVPKGALVMALAGQGRTKGLVAQLGIDATCNQSMAAIVPIARVQPRYVFWWLSANYLNIRNMAGGEARDGLNLEILGDIPCPIPSGAEQRAIADFLDRETAKIDTLVARKRTLIERLKEKRTALISHTVTRGLPPDAATQAGLDPHPNLKSSGVDWLGEVPEHWEVIEIGRKIELQRGVDITKDEQNEGGVPVVSSGGVASFHDHALAPGPGVVVGRKGTAGAVYYVPTDFWPHDTTLWVRRFYGNFPRYVFFKLLSMDLSSFDTGSANPTVNRSLAHSVVVSWPPIAEQVHIACFLDRETGKIDAMIAKVAVAIDRLKEYRLALIVATVTGKVDIRGRTNGV